MLPFVIFLLILALLAWLFSQRANTASGMPEGKVVYTDTGGWGRLEKPLFSERLQLTGKPDYLVREGKGYIPVEVKSGNAPPRGPHDSHIFQLAAYCALVDDAFNIRPSHGLIKYADKTMLVDYTEDLEEQLLELLNAIQDDSAEEDVPRSHNSAARCRGCGFKEVCDESLAA